MSKSSHSRVMPPQLSIERRGCNILYSGTGQEKAASPQKGPLQPIVPLWRRDGTDPPCHAQEKSDRGVQSVHQGFTLTERHQWPVGTPL